MRISLNIESRNINKFLVGNEWENTIGNTTRNARNVCLDYTHLRLFAVQV